MWSVVQYFKYSWKAVLAREWPGGGRETRNQLSGTHFRQERAVACLPKSVPKGSLLDWTRYSQMGQEILAHNIS